MSDAIAVLSLSDIRDALARNLPVWHLPELWLRRLHRYKMAISIVLSVVLHVLLLLLVLLPPPKGLAGGGSHGAGLSGIGTGYAEVSLYDDSHSDALKVKESTAEDEIDESEITQTTSAQNTQTLKPVNDISLTNLSIPDLLVPTERDNYVASAANTNVTTTGGIGEGGETSGMTAELWAAIAPCWKRMADGDTLAVSLEVSFAADGRLSSPPVIQRAENAQITNQSLHSETLALQALSACGGYPMASGQKAVKVKFPRPE